MSTSIVASIEQDFSLTQEASGWRYGWYTGSTPDTFTTSGISANASEWMGSGSFSTPRLGSISTPTFMHPGVSPDRPAVRRYEVQDAGRLQASGLIRKSSAGGDGVFPQIWVNDTQAASGFVSGSDTIGIELVTAPFDAVPGDFIDFAVGPFANTISDGSLFSHVIRRVLLDASLVRPGLVTAGMLKPALFRDGVPRALGFAEDLKLGLLDSDRLKPSLLDSNGDLKSSVLA
ncbi:MAG: hypothetical protein AAGI68_15545 [Planctomycetota bacterium]